MVNKEKNNLKKIESINEEKNKIKKGNNTIKEKNSLLEKEINIIKD